MYTDKLQAGSIFPNIKATLSGGEVVNLSEPEHGREWKMVVVYRGKHCPICTKYLNSLEQYVEDLQELGVDLIAVSADSEQQLKAHKEELNVSFPLAYGLTQEQMLQLGLYISTPRNAQETDHNFAEPALFVINGDGKIQIVEITNAPFSRPDLDILLSGLRFIRDPENNYPIRGTFSK
ncbi:peroxiredoxin family protein [Gilvimarinus sp. DA14]|uniref:peroxiredoxin family protein n=1 Tax=Gilvimarinus sp. DA14 TaxID=2956798 RepID=UPI0020B8BE67|nr:peroxiredoxin family protein [Gilvimarinus sp. DA14]UTF61716.1 peroxiredoxin family protein [Gilvimarinus sp. DA14]